MTSDDLWGHTSFKKRLGINKKYIEEKDGFEIKGDLMWPLMTSEVILYLEKNLRLNNVGKHRNLYQNLFIKEYAI